MKRMFLAVALLVAGECCAQVFADGFETTIAPVFPKVNGVVQLTPGPATTQMQWLLAELAAGETTTIAEVNAHFDPTYLAVAGQSASETKAKIDALRASVPNAKVVDLVTLTVMDVEAVVDIPGSGYPAAYVRLNTHYAGAGLILGFTVFNPFNGFAPAVVEDRTATLAQVAAKFDPAAPNTIVPPSGTSSLLVGRIDRNTGACSAGLAARQVDTLRGTGSIFKLWVLGGVARQVALGNAGADTAISLVAAKKAPSAELNTEPVGTPFSLLDLATMMMGVSDNTATNLLFQVAGRDTINQVVTDFGVAQPTVLTPFLDISEQFHILRSFPLATAQNYVAGTEPFQQQFLTDQIVPLGPVTTFPYFNTSLLVVGTWNATPMDICRAYSALRRGAGSSDAGAVVSRALTSTMVFADVRGAWDRVWFKAGSLGTGNIDGFHVLTYSWMLEDAGKDPYVVVGMINSETGGIDNANMQSALGRVLQLLRALPP